MVERTCPDCNGARLRATRLLFTIAGKTIHDVGGLHFDELHVSSAASNRPAAAPTPAARCWRRFADAWNCFSGSASII